jgi:hypothetical protein
MFEKVEGFPFNPFDVLVGPPGAPAPPAPTVIGKDVAEIVAAVPDGKLFKG